MPFTILLEHEFGLIKGRALSPESVGRLVKSLLDICYLIDRS